MSFNPYGIQNPYHEDNVRVVKAGMKRHLVVTGKPVLINMLRQVAQRMVDTVDRVFTPMPPYESDQAGNDRFPVWRGHMHDATGVAIYDDGVTISWLPTKKSIKFQAHEGKQVMGMRDLRDTIATGASKFSKGLWIVLFCAVPYAFEVNTYNSPAGRGYGFFDTLSEDFFKDVLMGLEAINL